MKSDCSDHEILSHVHVQEEVGDVTCFRLVLGIFLSLTLDSYDPEVSHQAQVQLHEAQLHRIQLHDHVLKNTIYPIRQPLYVNLT